MFFFIIKDSGYNSRIILAPSFFGENVNHNTKNTYLSLKIRSLKSWEIKVRLGNLGNPGIFYKI